MNEIKISGFRIFQNDGVHAYPIYSSKCASNVRHYIFPWSREIAVYDPQRSKLFHPKYYKKFLELYKTNACSELYNLIPHFTIDTESASCKHDGKWLGDPNPLNTNFFTEFFNLHQKAFSKMDVSTSDLLLYHLKKAENIPMGKPLGGFIRDYWVASCYDWHRPYPIRNNLSFDEIKKSLAATHETIFLTLIEDNINHFESEIKSILLTTMPMDLIKIIYSYGHSPLDIIAKIISIVKTDILKYGKLIE